MSIFHSNTYRFLFALDSYRKQVVIDDESCLLEILDTAGQEEFTALRDQWIRDCGMGIFPFTFPVLFVSLRDLLIFFLFTEGFVIIYSITSRSSFEQISTFKEQVFRVKDAERLPMMLVGNKCDLEEKREVSHQEGVELGKQFGAQFKETSAKTRVNVEEAFYDLVRMIREFDPSRQDMNKKEKKRGGGCALL
jgi:GTPase KRas protein